MFRLQAVLLFRCGVNADPQRFGEYQVITCVGGIVLLEMFSQCDTGNGQPKDRFRCVDTMAPRQRKTQCCADVSPP